MIPVSLLIIHSLLLNNLAIKGLVTRLEYVPDWMLGVPI